MIEAIMAIGENECDHMYRKCYEHTNTAVHAEIQYDNWIWLLLSSATFNLQESLSAHEIIRAGVEVGEIHSS